MILGKKCGFEFICTILKFLYRISPDDIKIPILSVTYKVRERIEKSYLWRCCNIIEKLPNMDQDRKIAAAKFFAEWKKRIAVPFLDKWMSEEPDPIVRSWIVDAIGEIGGRYAIKALFQAMADEYPLVRLRVTDALKKQGRRVLKKVIKAVSSDNPLKRLSAVEVLCSVGKDDPQVESVLTQLKSDPDKRVQNAVNICREKK